MAQKSKRPVTFFDVKYTIARLWERGEIEEFLEVETNPEHIARLQAELDELSNVKIARHLGLTSQQVANIENGNYANYELIASRELMDEERLAA